MKFELKNFERANTELSKKNKSFKALSQVIAHSFIVFIKYDRRKY